MSDFASLNGQRIVSAEVTIPYRGVWCADVVLDSSVQIGASVTLVIGNLTMIGFSFRMASFAGSRSARVIGGHGGWRNPVIEQGYYDPRGLKASTVIGDAASVVGESVVIKSDFTIGLGFVREAGPASRVLRQVIGTSWWVDPTGRTQCQDRTDTSLISTDFTVVGWSGAKGVFDIATEDVAGWAPGRTFSAPTVQTVQSIDTVTISTTNEGQLRLAVLSKGHENE